MNNRRGFTLIELLLSLFMMVVVAAGLYSLMVTVYRVTRRHTEMSNVQGNLRAGMQLMQSELQEIYTDAAGLDSDILTLGQSVINYWAMRGAGETCGITAGGGSLQIRVPGYSGRKPDVTRGDELLLFQDRDTTTLADDQWLKLPITGVADGTCAVGNPDASWDLTVPALTAGDLVEPVGGVDPWVFTPGPIRTREHMEMGLIADGGQDWLGLRSTLIEPSLIPVVGPLTAANGEPAVTFAYFDGLTSLTGDVNTVKTIVLKLRGISAQLVNTGLGSAQGNPQDSVTVRVQLRNSR